MSFQINLGSQGFWSLGLHWTSCMEPLYDSFCVFKTNLYLLQFLGECCIAVKLQNYFVESKLHLPFNQHVIHYLVLTWEEKKVCPLPLDLWLAVLFPVCTASKAKHDITHPTKPVLLFCGQVYDCNASRNVTDCETSMSSPELFLRCDVHIWQRWNIIFSLWLCACLENMSEVVWMCLPVGYSNYRSSRNTREERMSLDSK